ncbi:50S ribosomal protein L11 methyltransferase [Salinithrix halophila]|uniref:Ribosomal protein L11 methyltransferase n=1 Tax=Salinithrix halophila TaxID=1485204 RepID=A0ABV8JG52_9BACL
MDWMEVRIHTNREAEDAVANLLFEAGAEGTATMDSEALEREWDTRLGEIIALDAKDFPEEGVWISGYFPEQVYNPSLPGTLEEKTKELARFGLDPGSVSVFVRRVAEESWVNAWKAYYKPVRVTQRMTIKPVWEEYEAEPGEEVIEMDPGMAFGTGTHPTTTLSIQLMEKALRPGGSVIDVGCGSGILSAVAAKLGAREVLALDLDPVAVEATRSNIDLNGVADRVFVRQNDLLQGVDKRVDMVVANILAEIILRFTADVPRVLKPGGTFIASGIVQHKEETVTKGLAKAGLTVVEGIHDGDWVALRAQSC